MIADHLWCLLVGALLTLLFVVLPLLADLRPFPSERRWSRLKRRQRREIDRLARKGTP